MLRPRGPGEVTQKAFENDLLEGLEPSARAEAQQILRKMNYWLVVHIIKSSVVLMVASGIGFVIFVMTKLLRVMRERWRSSAHDPAHDEQIESTCLPSGSPSASVNASFEDAPTSRNQRTLRVWLNRAVLPRVDDVGGLAVVEEGVLVELRTAA
jgi:hypothetical protein